MQATTLNKSSNRRFRIFSGNFLGCLTGLAAFLALTSASQAATFYLTGGFGSDINALSSWNSARDGSGVAPTTFSGNDFYSNANNGNARWTGAGTTFVGNSFVLEGNAGDQLRVKYGGTSTLSALISQGGGRIFQALNGPTTLDITSFTNNGTTYLDSEGARQISLNIDTMTGSGNLSLVLGAATTGFSLSMTTATAYTGNIVWGDANNSYLDFNNDLVSAGGLIALSTSRINLDQNVTFANATLNGVTLTPGTYSYAALSGNGTYGSDFLSGGSGSITVVPEPSTYAMMLGGFGLLVVLRRMKLRTK